jgi:hypothetical protein
VLILCSRGFDLCLLGFDLCSQGFELPTQIRICGGTVLGISHL